MVIFPLSKQRPTFFKVQDRKLASRLVMATLLLLRISKSFVVVRSHQKISKKVVFRKLVILYFLDLITYNISKLEMKTENVMQFAYYTILYLWKLLWTSSYNGNLNSSVECLLNRAGTWNYHIFFSLFSGLNRFFTSCPSIFSIF